MQFSLNLVCYLVLVPILLVITVHTAMKRPLSRTNKMLMASLICINCTCICVMLSLLFTDHSLIIFFNEAKFVPYAFVPPFLLFFYYNFFDMRGTLFERSVILSIPCVIVFIAVTNPRHWLFRTSYVVSRNSAGMLFFDSHNGPFFYIFVAYCYAIVILAFVMLAQKTLRRPRVYRGQGFMMSATMLAAVLASTLVNFLGVDDYVDVTVVSLSLSGVVAYIGTILYSPSKMLTSARTMAINSMDSPFVLFDDRSLLIDYNPSASDVLHLSHDMIYILRFSEFCGRFLHSEVSEANGREIMLERSDDEAYYYRVHVTTVKDSRAKDIGLVVQMENITQGMHLLDELNTVMYYDHLTGLPNREAFRNAFEELCSDRSRLVTLVYLNVIGIKLINRAFGMSYGDEVLRAAASAIQDVLGEAPPRAHLNGDRFVFLLADRRENEAPELVAGINRILSSKPDLKIPVTFAFGVAGRMWDSEPLERLLRRAMDDCDRRRGDGISETDVLPSLTAALGALDDGAPARLERMSALAGRFGHFLGMEPTEIKAFTSLASLCDIGMLSMPEPHTGDAAELIRRHAVAGYRIALSSPQLAPIANAILSHHEWWDGSGYPNRIGGRDIPLAARAVAVLDAWDGFRSGSGDDNTAAIELRRRAGRQLDPELVEKLLEMLKTEL